MKYAIAICLIASVWALIVAYRTDIRMFNLKMSLDKQYYLQRDIDRRIKVRLMNLEEVIKDGKTE